MQRIGIGTLLARFCLADTIANQRPWQNKQEISTIVHEDNTKPRPILDEVGFVYSGTIEIPGDKAPSSLLRNPNGHVVAHKFIFPHHAVRGLFEYFNNFTGSFGSGGAYAVFSVPPAGLDSLREALQEALEELDN